MDKITEINVCIQSVLLRMNPSETGSKAVFEALMKLVNNKIAEEDEDISFVLTNLVNFYLKTEWDVLKRELESYDEEMETK